MNFFLKITINPKKKIKQKHTDKNNNILEVAQKKLLNSKRIIKDEC